MRPAGNEAGADHSTLRRSAAEGFSHHPSDVARQPKAKERMPCELEVRVMDRVISATTAIAATTPTARVFATADDVLSILVRVGQRHAPREHVTPALLQYWRLLTQTDAAQRATLLAGLRGRVRAGATTHRAWLPVVLGETEPTLVTEAVAGYLGVPPVSVERREAALADVLDWLRRGLALNRVAVFAALLLCDDEAVLERLRAVRGSLTDAEAASVLVSTSHVTSDAVQSFCEDWRATLGQG
jgi:hypothetical protein